MGTETIMREILSCFWTTYTLYFERGRLIPLFLTAVIILILTGKKYRGRIHPLLFVLSVWTAVSYAFSSLIFSLPQKEETKDRKKRTGMALLCVFLCVLMIVFSGSSILSDRFLESSAERKNREETLKQVCETILSDDAQAKIVASADIMPHLLAYSSAFVPLYRVPESGKAEELPKEEHRLYEIFSSQHPDFEQVHRLCHEQKRFYAIVDHENMWPENGFDYGFDLLTTVDHYEIYAYTGGTNE